MDATAQIEKKLALSLDELIAAQAKKKKAGGNKPAAAAAKKKSVQQTKGGGRVLVVPRPKNVPRPSQGRRPAAALKGTRGGGVQKGGPAPKFVGGVGRPSPQGRQASNRNVKVTIGNKLSGRPGPLQAPTSGVLSKPFAGGANGGMRGGRAPMPTSAPAGGSLGTRFDIMSGAAPSGPARPMGQPRRNAHGVILP